MVHLRFFLFFSIAAMVSFQTALGGTNGSAPELASRLKEALSNAGPAQNSASARHIGDPKAQEAYLARIQEQHDQEIQNIQQSIDRLKALLTLHSYDDAKNTLRGIERRINSLSPTGEVTALLLQLTAEIDKMESAYHLKWYRIVDEKVAETRQSCLAAENAMELDELMIELATIEMKRPRNNRTLLHQRAEEKLRGITHTLQHYMRYLDYKSINNGEAANEQLERILKNNPGFPVLSAEELNQKKILEAEPKELSEVFGQILLETQDYRNLDDTIKILTAKLSDPDLIAKGSIREGCEWALDRVKKVQQGYSALGNDDIDEAQRILQSFNRGKRYGGDLNAVQEFEKALESAIDKKRIELLTGKSLPEGANSERGLEVYKKELYKAGKFGELVQILEIQNPFTTPRYHRRNTSLVALRHFLAGQRFEEAGDPVSAYGEYRKVVEQPADEFVPHDEAIGAMKRLRKENPDSISKFDEDSLYREIQQEVDKLDDSLRVLRRRPL